MKTISTHTFKHTLRDVHKNTENRKFCFVIGAGASRKSGIPTGGELAHKWFSEIKDRLDGAELKAWKKEQKIDEKDLAASYGSIYRKRFENDKTSGYESLVQAMKSAKPSFGHIVLAQILSRTSGHCVLTTNFDSLVESSIYQFTSKTPLVCGHESLSGYARPSQTHPLVVKIHRDLLLAPKSDPDEINTLDPGWKEPLDHIFSTHIPIIVGYGGNDGSLMSYFETMNKPSNFFWCGLSSTNLSSRIKQLIKKHEGSFVRVEGFDELMHELLWVFDEIKPIKEELGEITNERIQIATNQLEEITSRKINIGPKAALDASISINKNELSALEFGNKANSEPDLEKRKHIYLEALEKYPKTEWLWWDFTYFLHFIKKDYDNLDQYYQKAVELNKKESGLLGNYALFLSEIVKDYIKAEEYYLMAITQDPNDERALGSYAIFLSRRKKDNRLAEAYHRKAIAKKPMNPDCHGRYANFLREFKKNYPKAEESYLRAISLDPDSPWNAAYANILQIQKKNFDEVEEHYQKALQAHPHDVNIICLYGEFLKAIKNDRDNAKIYYQKALSIDSNDQNLNGNYAQFLLETGETHEAEKHLQIAFNDREEDGLLIELWFYRYAHFPEFRTEAEGKIQELLSKNIRSLGWNFENNIEQALKDNHPDPKRLKQLAKQISSENTSTD